ncbi:sensor histidine kinase [Domibacillus enclensis]|uniref:Heme sensor protein HssS n=1 Tax=Domibacillus enclensis TaxID=1017273 RepID=A0A1N7AT48_9BACI|nr:HAMP domain-containing sensor histidine kinase [Domibacillus enclensis]OXS75072.1 two-component sensor histidine kinase [Domibacillus enclensis]SIR42234.1 Signal transduction histidine kinase [Domibacillus enclensis]
MKSLYGKFAVITISIMVLSSIVAFLLSNVYYQQHLKPLNDQKNTRIAESIAAFVQDNPSIDLEDYLSHTAETGYQLYLMDATGHEQSFGAPFRDLSLSDSAKKHVLDGHIYHGIRHFPTDTFVTGFFANELRNSIGVPLTYNNTDYALFIRPDIALLFNEMHYLFAWLLVLSIVLSIVFVLIGTNYLIKPIATLTKATHSLANGQFHLDLPTARKDELGQLAKSFVHMAKKLQQLDDTRKEFISNISHDIQSPLSNMKGYTGLLEKEQLNEEEKNQYISIINGEINRLSTLTKQLLLLASLDRNEDLLQKQPVNISTQVKELIRNAQWSTQDKGISLSYSLPDLTINGDPSLLNTVWDNLLTNAIKYNRPNGSIDISLKRAGSKAIMTFSDTGIGMQKSELDRIFERFYRIDTARTRSIDGTGLGLSIVADIVDLHGGQVNVVSIPGEGTAFRVELPIA